MKHSGLNFSIFSARVTHLQLRQIHFATVSHAVSQPGLDLGGSFGRFHVARRFGRKLQTPFIGFGKGQSHELLGRSERPSDRGRPRMRNRPPSLAIQVLAESHHPHSDFTSRSLLRMAGDATFNQPSKPRLFGLLPFLWQYF